MSDLVEALRGASEEQVRTALSSLSADARALLTMHQAQQHLASYVWYLDIGFVPAAHHLLLIQELEAVERGETERLIVNMPPGSAKSTYTSVLFPAWYLGRNEKANVLAASNTHDLAEHFGRRVRNLFGSTENHSLWGYGLSHDSQAADDWATERGGLYYAAGVGSAIAGRRADLGLIDDPVKSREEADSDRVREKSWQWYLNDFKTRLKPGARQVVIMTRWHEDDLGGRLLATEGDSWRVVKLPMEAMPGDPLGRAVGERLWPEWFTQAMVDDAKRDVRVWNALYQQEPTGEEGDYFKREWFRDAEEQPKHLAIYGASDYAVTERAGDFTEHGIFGVDAWSNVFVLDWWRDQSASDVWIEKQCDMIARHNPLAWFGESGPIRRAIEPFLMKRMEDRRTYCRLEWLPSIADKPTRCRPFQAMASMGKVWFPQTAGWKSEVIGQLLRFPAGMHDDAVDVCSLIGRGLEMIEPPDIQELAPQLRANMAHEHLKRRRF